jgi:tetratricopeptide (TPR) repeat protein
MLAKPNAVVVPALAWVLDVAFLSREPRAATRRVLPWLVLAIPCALWTRHFQPAGAVGQEVPIYLRPLVALDAVSFYLIKLVWPARLGVDYGRTPQWVIESGRVWFTWVIAAPVIVCILATRKRAPELLAALAVFIVALTPVLGLVPFDFQAYSTVADHYLYLAMLGPALLFAVLAARRSVILNCMLLFLIAACGVKAHIQTMHWRNTETVFTQALRVNPRSWAAHAQLASYYASLGDYPRALQQAQEAARINDRAFTAHNLVGSNLAKLGRRHEAIAAYRRALAIHPRDGLANVNLANLLADERQYEEAIRHYRIAMEVDPASAVPLANLASVLAEMGNLDEAIELYREALRRDPVSRDAQSGLARALAARGAPATAPRE